MATRRPELPPSSWSTHKTDFGSTTLLEPIIQSKDEALVTGVFAEPLFARNMAMIGER